MKETNLNIFYHFGASLDQLNEQIKTGMELAQIFSYLVLSQEWLKEFLAQTEEFEDTLRDSRACVQEMLTTSGNIYESARTNWDRSITHEEVTSIIHGKEKFEKSFEREHRNLSVFTVTPKGLYDVRLLIEKAERKFGDQTRSVFTEQVIYDLQQSGRCLAFEVPTAMAFHVMRATESLIKNYYEVLAGKPWPHVQRDWGKYIAELEQFPDVDLVITGRLKEIKNLNRNPLIHPEDVVSLEEAPIIFDLCNGVIYYMAEEVRTRKPQ